MTERDVGGIYLHTQHLACSEVARVIEAYWTARGAYRVERDPYLVPAFDAERTGLLSISLSCVCPDRILVRDSERHTCDWELARALHEALGVEVLAYATSESLARAHAMRWSKGELSHEREPARVEALLAELPGAFELLPSARPLEDPIGTVFLTFDGIGLPSELPSSYAGPELDSEMGRSLVRRKARYLLTQRSLELPSFLDEHPFLARVLLRELGRLPLQEAAVQQLVLALEGPLISHKLGLERLAYSAHRAGRPGLVARAEAGLSEDERFAGRRNWLYLLAREGAWEQALAAFVELEARATPNDYELNNLCHILAHLGPDSLSPDTLARYLARARERAEHNPHIFHNLACVLLRRGDVEGALDCVEGAIARRYPLIERMREDLDLAALHQARRWQTAWAQYDELQDAHEHDDAPRLPPTRKIVVPGVGIELEGLGMLSIDLDIDELIDLVGEVSSDIDAAHGIYRFNQIGLVHTHYDGQELVSFVDPDPRTIVAGVDLWAVDAHRAVAQVWEALGEEPWYIYMGDGECYYVFREAKLALVHARKASGARLSSVIVRSTWGSFMARELEGSLLLSEAERVRQAREQEQRHRALRSYFARLDQH